MEQALRVVVLAQLAMVEDAFRTVPAMLAEQGLVSDPVAALSPLLMLGTASDGRPMRSLLELSGTDAEFDRIVRTQLSDVARSAEAVARTVEPAATHYVRALSLPSCGRCVVLAGKPSRSDVAFQRHPRCDCRSVPTSERLAGRMATDPRDAYEQMTQAERDRAFTAAGAEAIGLGADVGQVVNARRGITTATVGGRTVSTTISNASVGRPRLMPESILQVADSKPDAVRMLRTYGYLP